MENNPQLKALIGKDTSFTVHGPEPYKGDAKFCKIAIKEQDLELVCVVNNGALANGPFTLKKSDIEFQQGVIMWNTSDGNAVVKLLIENKRDNVIQFEARKLIGKHWETLVQYTYMEEGSNWILTHVLSLIQRASLNIQKTIEYLNSCPQFNQNILAVDKSVPKMIHAGLKNLGEMIDYVERVRNIQK